MPEIDYFKGLLHLFRSLMGAIVAAMFVIGTANLTKGPITFDQNLAIIILAVSLAILVIFYCYFLNRLKKEPFERLNPDLNENIIIIRNEKFKIIIEKGD